jgi:AraC-like DNA-binding protein
MLKSKAGLSPQMRQLKFMELMQYLLEKDPESILAFQNKQKEKRSGIEIRKVVESNITNNLTVEELAFLCNLSPSTFKRRFAKIYKTAPNAWLLEQRMNLAANLLRNHGEKPGDIYYRLGYQNHSSFTKSFRKYFGVSPSSYLAAF